MLPDPKFGSGSVKVHECGYAGWQNPSQNESFYGALDQIQKKSSKGAVVSVQSGAVKAVKFVVEVKKPPCGWCQLSGSGGLRPSRRMAWLCAGYEAARKRGEKSMALRLAGELLDASEGRGGAMEARRSSHGGSE